MTRDTIFSIISSIDDPNYCVYIKGHERPIFCGEGTEFEARTESYALEIWGKIDGEWVFECAFDYSEVQGISIIDIFQ